MGGGCTLLDQDQEGNTAIENSQHKDFQDTILNTTKKSFTGAIGLMKPWERG